MKCAIRLRSVAEKDVADCARVIQDRSPDAAIRFLDAFDATLSLLQRWPGIGSLCRFENPLFEGIRAWPISTFKNHLIFYRLLPDEIEVVRVLHGAHDLNAIFGPNQP